LEAWELIKIKGISLRIHSSWLVILFLFTWTAQEQVANLPDLDMSFLVRWGIGFLTALLLFLSVLLHELGHSFMALREGVKVNSITLFFLGGVAKVERECETALGSLRVALAGPLVSFFLAIICFGFMDNFFNKSIIISNLLEQIGSLNLVLGLFNLLPGLPLDGGIILKSIVWHFTGNQRKGMKVAIATGRFLSLFAIFIGTWFSLRGAGLAGLWLIVLGWIGFTTSRSQNKIILLQEVLGNLIVSDACSKRFRVLEKDMPLRRISELRLNSADNVRLREWILICDIGVWIGYINDSPLSEIKVQDWDQYCVGDYARPLSDLPSISGKLPLWQSILKLEETEEGRLLVLSPAGLPIGTLDRSDIGLSVLRKIGMNIPYEFVQLARKQNTYPLGLALPQIVEGMVTSGIIKKID
tara:strand:- start:5372 stop:6613 length:1242 start_codon:yes stop_codon:yes gene_type:complete